MFEKPKAVHALGLEKGPASIKCAALSFRKNKPALDSVFEMPHDQEDFNVKQFYTTERGKKLKFLLDNNLVITGLNTNEVLVRPFEVKLKKEKDIDAVLAFQIEPLLPYPIENAQADKIVLSKGSEGTQLTIVAARKDHFQLHLDQWKALNIEPEVVSAVPAALAEFSRLFVTSDGPLIVLHLGMNAASIILVNEGKVIAAQSISQGIDHLAEALSKDRQIQPEEALNLLYQVDLSQTSNQEPPTPMLAQAVDNLKLEITRTLYALAKQIKDKEVNDVLITGEGAVIDNLPHALCRNLNKNILFPKEDLNFDLTSAELQKFAIHIGLALSALPNASDQLNFRQQEFAYSDPWKRLKKPLALYFALCLFSALALYFLANAYQSYNESQLRMQYLELLNVMNKPYSQFEKEFTGGQTVVEAQQLSQGDIRSRLDYLQKEIQSTPQTYPLLPQVPLVSDIMAWLSTHPNIAVKGEGANLPNVIQIESLSYTMVKRPEITKKQEKYQVKVEIEFSSPTPKMAREFHDALIAPNDIVDPKAEIKWSSNRDLYRASFFLKDKTVYP